MSQNIADMVPFAKMMGMKITPTSKDKIDGTMTVRPDQCTTMGGLHGGAVMSFADSLGATGAFINLPEGAAGTTTLESKTNFISPALVNSEVTGVSIPLHKGRRTSVWQTTLTREDGKTVAVVTQTQIYL